MQVLGVAMPFLLVQDTARVVGFTMFRTRVAAINDGVWAGLLVLALGGLALFDTSATPVWVYLAAWAVTGAAGRAAHAPPAAASCWTCGVASPDTKETFRLGLPLLANYLLTSAPPYLLFLITPAVAGLAELGVLRAAFIPYGPFGVLLQGMQLVALPYAMKMPARRRWSAWPGGCRSAWPWWPPSGACWSTWCSPTSIGTWLIGDLWEATETTRALFAIAVVGDALTTGPLLALRALRAPGRLVRVRLLSGPTTLVLGLVLLPVLGAEGVAVAIIVGFAVALVVSVVELRLIRGPRRTRAGRRGARPATGGSGMTAPTNGPARGASSRRC